LFSTLVNLIAYRYKGHSQNKVDSTVNKNRDLLNLLVQSWICEQRACYFTTVYCLLGFIFSGHANCIITQGYVVRDDLAVGSSLSIIVEKIKIIQKNCQKEYHSELLKYFRRQVRYA